MELTTSYQGESLINVENKFQPTAVVPNHFIGSKPRLTKLLSKPFQEFYNLSYLHKEIGLQSSCILNFDILSHFFYTEDFFQGTLKC